MTATVNSIEAQTWIAWLLVLALLVAAGVAAWRQLFWAAGALLIVAIVAGALLL